MSGVEILSSEVIYTVETFVWLLPVFAGVGLLVGLIIAIVDWVDCGFDFGGIVLAFALAALGLFIGVLGALIFEHDTDIVDHIEYKVTVSEEVNFVEFLDKYEILDQEGKIFTVRERDR